MGNEQPSPAWSVNESWRTFLLDQGAVYDDGLPRHFGDPSSERRAARSSDVMADLSSLALIRASGPDAKIFLDGQLTNGLDSLGAHHSLLAAWCNAKGRMLAVFRIFLRDGEYYLQLPMSLRDDVLRRLRVFILRSKVTLESADRELVRFGLVGPTAASSVHKATGLLPEGDNDCVTRGALTVIRLPGMFPRFEIVAPVEDATRLWEELRHGAVPTGSSVWAWHDIMAGLPTVLPATSEAFVPQMVNLELIGGVSFKKGCYPGQEIVARMQYLGRLKQRTVRAQVAAPAPVPGTPIFAPNMPGQSVGTVVDAQPSPEEGSDLLAVVQLSSIQANELHLGSETGPLLEIRPLPYSLDSQ